MAVLLGGPSLPSPPQAGLWLTSATATSHQWPEAASGKSTWFSLSPLKPFLPQFIC